MVFSTASSGERALKAKRDAVEFLGTQGEGARLSNFLVLSSPALWPALQLGLSGSSTHGFFPDSQEGVDQSLSALLAFSLPRLLSPEGF